MDDHDYGGNDMGKFMPNRPEREDAYWKFLGYRPHDHGGLYHSIDNLAPDGKLKLILLDTRSFREDHCVPSAAHVLPMGNVIACLTRWLTAGLNLWKYASLWGANNCEQRTMLGEEQWQWLERELRGSRADLNIIVSSVQIWTTNPAMESWGHFPREQDRLWRLLQTHYGVASTPEKKQPGPVIFWSGDVHHGEILGQDGFVEVTSSGMTHHCGQPKLYGALCKPLLRAFRSHRHSPDEFFVGLNYGVLDVNWNLRQARVQVKNDRGSTVLQIEQSLDAPIHLPGIQQLPRAWDGHLVPLLQRITFALVLSIGIFGRFSRRKRTPVTKLRIE